MEFTRCHENSNQPNPSKILELVEKLDDVPTSLDGVTITDDDLRSLTQPEAPCAIQVTFMIPSNILDALRLTAMEIAEADTSREDLYTVTKTLRQMITDTKHIEIMLEEARKNDPSPELSLLDESGDSIDVSRYDEAEFAEWEDETRDIMATFNIRENELEYIKQTAKEKNDYAIGPPDIIMGIICKMYEHRHVLREARKDHPEARMGILNILGDSTRLRIPSIDRGIVLEG